MKRLSLCFILVLALLLAAGCGVRQGTCGSLSIRVGQDLNRTIVPDVDMTVAAYDITGAGPGGSAFQRLGVTAAMAIVAIDDLPVGAWTINVMAKNPGGTEIGFGSSQTMLNPETTAEAVVTVTPLAGYGSLSITVSWPAGAVAVPHLMGMIGDFRMASFTLAADGHSASSRTDFLNAGYYELKISLMDGADKISGAVTLVRILAGHDTGGRIDFGLSADTGSVQVSILPNLQNPIDLTISGVPACVAAGGPIAAAAAASAPADGYEWYLDGEPLQSGGAASVRFNAPARGFHHLDVLARKGTCVLGAASADFQVGAETGSWNYLVYVAGDGGLESQALIDLNEMEAVGSSGAVNILALVDRHPGYDASSGDWSETRLYRITRDADRSTLHSTPVEGYPAGELDMTSPATLSGFIVYCQEHFPAAHTALTIYGEGRGVQGICLDETSNGTSPATLTLRELQGALWQARAATGRKIDLLNLDGSGMMLLETAYELRNEADYLVGTSHDAGRHGYNDYTLLLGHLVSNPAMTPEALAARIVDDWAAAYTGADLMVTSLALKLGSRMNELANAFNNFARALRFESGDSRIMARISQVIDRTPSYGQYNDLSNLLFGLESEFKYGDPEICNTASNLEYCLSDAIVNCQSVSPMIGSLGVMIPSDTNAWRQFQDPTAAGNNYGSLFLCEDFGDWCGFLEQLVAYYQANGR